MMSDNNIDPNFVLYMVSIRRPARRTGDRGQFVHGRGGQCIQWYVRGLRFTWSRSRTELIIAILRSQSHWSDYYMHQSKSLLILYTP